MIEDFFRLAVDVLIYHSQPFIASHLMPNILTAATSTLTVLKEEPIITTLHFLRDFLGHGSPNPPSSRFADEGAVPAEQKAETQAAVKQLLHNHGEALTQRVMAGMMYTFPGDCIPDASGIILEELQLLPTETATWIANTVALLPPGSISPQEQERVLRNIDQ